MQDINSVNELEVMVDSLGKLWINADGKCILRIGHCNAINYDTTMGFGRTEFRVIKEEEE